MSTDVEDLLWFSHSTAEYEVQSNAGGKHRKKFVLKKDRSIKLDWDNCTVNIARILPDGNVRFVIRSMTNRNSDYMGGIPVQLRFMLAIDINPAAISELRIDRNYSLAESRRKRLPEQAKKIEHDRWVFNLGDRAEVWEWTREGTDMRSSRVYKLHRSIRKFLDSPGQAQDNVFRVQADRLDKVVPVIYQPAVDSLDNFLREVHSLMKANADGSADVHVSLVFNNEQLRKFRLANGIYRWIRKLLYGREIDIESFRVHFVRDRADENFFVFERIYSADKNLEWDTTHEDPVFTKRPIEYYFLDHFHPVVFVNTSNHAMAGHDNNGELWKWEYVPWVEKAPIVLGAKSRSELDSQFKYTWLTHPPS